MRSAMMIVAAVGIALPVMASAHTDKRLDLAYCNALSDTYVRYIGRDETSPRLVIRANQGNATGYVAVAQYRQGNAAASIPVLERS
jgi:adenosine/AMP kinase